MHLLMDFLHAAFIIHMIIQYICSQSYWDKHVLMQTTGKNKVTFLMDVLV